jgi:hypothetical protein
VSIVTPNEDRAVRSLLSGAGVHAEQRDTMPGEPEMAALTGAREPSGIALVEPTVPSRSRDGGRPSWRDRSGAERQPRPTAWHDRSRTEGGRPARPAGRSASSAPAARRSHG